MPPPPTHTHLTLEDQRRSWQTLSPNCLLHSLMVVFLLPPAGLFLSHTAPSLGPPQPFRGAGHKPETLTQLVLFSSHPPHNIPFWQQILWALPSNRSRLRPILTGPYPPPCAWTNPLASPHWSLLLPLTPPLTGCASLGRFLNLPGPFIPHRQMDG